jgi:CRP/FNR family transcriptional regulator, anaerobic regulatory protein
MRDLFLYIQKNIPYVDASIEEDIESHFKKVFLSKGEALIKEGQVNKNVYFVNKGILRNFLMKDGTDITTWFFFPEDFITTFESFQLQIPGIETSEALTDCELFYISFEELEKLNNDSHQWERISRIFIMRYAFQQGNRLLVLQTMTAEEKYDYLIKNAPQVVQNIPNKYVASYLGITRETLSRIRAKKS